MVLIGWLILAAVYTRYDGWILGAAVWCVIAWQLLRKRGVVGQGHRCISYFDLAGSGRAVSWLWYNHHFMGDALDFLRGPYSAAAIEKRTSPPGSSHYHGWHNPFSALMYYTRTAQVDAAVWETGFVVMALAVAGLVVSVRRRFSLTALLLWIPLPFYVYSIAYGSVPIFIPQLYPRSYYNSRYGMEMLPALAIFLVLALSWVEDWWDESNPLQARLLMPVSLALVMLNGVGMMYSVPLVLKEAQVNSVTRMAFERSLAQQLLAFPPGVSIMMYNSDHVGALQQAGMPLKQTVNEGDYDSWRAALDAPAAHAAYVIAMDGDPVTKAVAAHPEGLTELSVLCTTGQGCARVYKSDRFRHVDARKSKLEC